MPTTSVKPNLFAKAKGRVADAPVGPLKKRETVWSVSPQAQGHPQLRAGCPHSDAAGLDESVGEIIRLQAELKTLETRQSAHKRDVQDFADRMYVDHLARTGVEPASPLRVSNSAGEAVTYVVTDRCHLVKVSDEQALALAGLLGADAAGRLFRTGGEFKFSPDVMSQPALNGEGTVLDVVAEAISSSLQKAVEMGVLSQEQVDGLLEYKEERRFKPGLVPRAGEICGRDANRIDTFLNILASGATRYIRA